MNPRIYKPRKVDFRGSQLNLEASYKNVMPANWSDFQIRQVAHLIKWASVSFNIRQSVKLSKSLLVRELGQRGYLKHIHSVFPIVQGHNLGQGQVTVYDYRVLLKTIVKWVREMGIEALEQFKLLLKAVLDDLEQCFGKRMGWFYRMVSFWFGKFTDTFKILLQERKVTTIQESYKIKSRSLRRGAEGEAEAIRTSSSRTISSDSSRCSKLSSLLSALTPSTAASIEAVLRASARSRALRHSLPE